MVKIDNAVSKVFALTIRSYQYFVRPLIGNRCRFYPSCSTYSLEAIERFGSLQGFYLSLSRVLRCHPFHQGGLDPVPEKNSLCQSK